MKKLLFSLLLTILMFTSSPSIKANTAYRFSVNDWEEFYKYLGNNIRYPSKAADANVQGNSLILFAVSKGKLKDLSIQNELGSGCDTEVLNKILSFPNFATAKDGNYALKTFFKLDGNNAEVKNENVKIPSGYTELKINIIGFSPKKDMVTSFSYGKKINTGTQKTIEIRGINKEFPENVLILVDGNIIENSSLNSIDPNQIESLDILKDANATSLYGDKGKNGVITITTKKTSAPLTGSVKGLSIQENENTKANLIIRGEKTWGKEEPLIIINGEIAELNTIDPDDVESLEILKDASSLALYGDKGKNGVITIKTKKTTSPLTGSVKGLSIQEDNNNKVNLIIRGEKTWSKEDPLIVINGEIAELNTVDPSDVESITVLKDASSTALYGDKAKSGVIIITTKKGTTTVNEDPLQKNSGEAGKSNIMIRGKKSFGTGQDPL